MAMFRFDVFLHHLNDSQRAPATIREYRRTLSDLARQLTLYGPSDDRAIRGEHIAAFLEDLRQRRPSEDYVAKVAGMLKTYFRFLVEHGLLLCSPMTEWKTNRAGMTHYPVVSRRTLDDMLEAVDGDDPMSIRGRAMLELAYSSALRPREIYNLKLRDVDHRQGVVFIDQSKGRKDRLVPAGQRALASVDRYVT